MGHILSRPIRPSLIQIHRLKSELSSLKHGNVIYFLGCGFMSWMLAPTSLILGGALALVAIGSGVQYLDRIRDGFLLDNQRTDQTNRPPQTPEEDLIQEYKNAHMDISLHRKSFAFSLGQLPLLGISLLGCISTGNVLGAALLCAAVGYSTKQTFKSLQRWDDGLIHKKHIQEDLKQIPKDLLHTSQPGLGTLPDLSYRGVTSETSPKISQGSGEDPSIHRAPSLGRKNKI